VVVVSAVVLHARSGATARDLVHRNYASDPREQTFAAYNAFFVEMKVLGVADIDGAFGTRLQSAATTFLSDSGSSADGIVGPLTRAALPENPNVPQLAGTLAPLAGLVTV